MTNQVMPRRLSYRNIDAARNHDLAPAELEAVFTFGESAFLGNGRWVVFLNEAMADHLARIDYIKSPKVVARLRDVNIICNAAGDVMDVFFARNDRKPVADMKEVSGLIRGRDDLECDCEGQD